jgi:hypothetical protein
MYFEAPPEGAAPLSLPRIHTVTMGLMALPTVGLFLVAWTPVEHFINGSLLQWFPTVAAAAAKTAALP